MNRYLGLYAKSLRLHKLKFLLQQVSKEDFKTKETEMLDSWKKAIRCSTAGPFGRGARTRRKQPAVVRGIQISFYPSPFILYEKEEYALRAKKAQPPWVLRPR